MIDEEAFLEHAEVFGNHYGTAKQQVQDLRTAGRDVILEIDWQGAAQVRRLVTDALSIFILPPSEAALAERLNNRGQDSAEIIEARLAEARLDMSKAGDFHFIVVNDDFATALADMLAVVRAQRLSTQRQVEKSGWVRAALNARG